MTESTVAISAAVEGIVDEAVAKRLIESVGGYVGPVHGKKGKPFLRENIGAYNHAARWAPWLVLVDLDSDHLCAGQLRSDWLADPTSGLCLRVATRTIESWLMADRDRIAAFLRISKSLVDKQPEALEDPKQRLVQLAGRSKSRAIRQDMVPRPKSGRSSGPAYSSRMIEFVETHWRPEVASSHSDSLRRAITALKSLVHRFE